MTAVLDLLLLSINDWRRSLSLASAALAKPDSEIFFVDPNKIDSELFALKLLAARLPLRVTDATGDDAFSEALRAAPELNLQQAAASIEADPVRLGQHFGPPRGLVCAPADDPVRCLKGAVLAVRLGYYFIPCGGTESHSSGWCELFTASGLAFHLPLIWLGPAERPPELSAAAGLHDFTALPDDPALARFMLRQGLEIDYLLIYNSADLEQGSGAPRSPGEAWVKGLSLLAPLCASYRHVFPYDAAAARPEPAEIEKGLNRFVSRAGLRPRYMALLASPGAIPLLYEPRRTIGSTSEEMAREIHLRLNDDIFFDTAEGRLFQSSPGGLSTQILTTKYYHRLPGARQETRKVLVAASPAVEYKIIFNSDDPLLETQFTPLLEQCGYRVTLLQGQEARADRIAAALKQSDFFLYAGHGTTEALMTCGHFLTRNDLPLLPPLVAYASACTTVGMDPYWVSASDGLDWEGIPVPYRDQFGLAMVEQGAVCYAGGITSMDLQFATSIYPIFFEGLLVKGLSVGEALQETRHFVSLYASLLQQKAPERYGCYKWWIAATLQQQILLGDPALVPVPRQGNAGTALPRQVEPEGDRYRVTVSIPENRWRHSRKPVHPGEATRSYYRTRHVEVISPYGEDVVSWGDFYRLAPGADNMAENAVMASYLHLYLDLPLALMPLRLKLAGVKEAGYTCLLCGREAEPPREIAALFQDFRIPFLMMPAVRFDYREGWAFAVEERSDCHRVHWLVPLLVIDEATRAAVRAGELTFELHTAAALTFSGKVQAPGAATGSSFLVSAGTARPSAGGKKEETGETGETLAVAVQAVTRPGGSFKIKCAAVADAASVDAQFPLYEILEPYRAFQKELWPLSLPEPVLLSPREALPGQICGKVLDAVTAAPLPGALVRAWRGETDPSGDLMTEGFAGEASAAADGSFELALPAGQYQLYAVARAGGVDYKSQCFTVESTAGDRLYLILPLEAGARVCGRVYFAGAAPLYPVKISLKRYRGGAPGETLAAVHAGRDGSFAALVAARERFCVVIEEEGWRTVEDSSLGHGFKLQPGEELRLSYTLEPREG